MLNLFDKCCAVLAFVLGVIFILLGAVGVFFGSAAHFTLPPILGGLPLLVGWGIVRCVIIAFRHREPAAQARLSAGGGIDDDLPCIKCGYDLRSMRPEGNCPECGTPIARSAQRFTRFDSSNLYRPSRERIESAGVDIPDDSPIELDLPPDDESSR